MKCYLIRHGITEGNKTLSFNGCRTDEPLSAEGREALRQIEHVADGAVLFSSPMKRAIETASIMLPGLSPVVIDEFREMDFGDFEGKNHSQLDGDPKYQEWLDSGGLSTIPGGESIKGFGERIALGLHKAAEIAKEERAEAIYIVAHGGTIMAMMSYLTGIDYFKFNLPNGAGYEIELETDDGGNVLAATAYDRFFGGLCDGSADWRPPKNTPSDKMDR